MSVYNIASYSNNQATALNTMNAAGEGCLYFPKKSRTSIALKLAAAAFLLLIGLSQESRASVFNVASSGNNVFTAQSNLASALWGTLYFPTQYIISSPLSIAWNLQEEVKGDGFSTGLFYNGGPNSNILIIGSATNYGAQKHLADFQLSSTGVANTTAVLCKRQGSLNSDNIYVTGVTTGYWLVECWAPRWNNSTFKNIAGDAIGFDNITPANDATLTNVNGFDVQGCFVSLYNESNGLYFRGHDVEGGGKFLCLRGSAGMTYRGVVIETGDIEGMSEFIDNPNNLILDHPVIRSNSYAETDIDISYWKGGEFKYNVLYNSDLVVNQSTNTDFDDSTICDDNILLGTSTCTVNP